MLSAAHTRQLIIFDNSLLPIPPPSGRRGPTTGHAFQPSSCAATVRTVSIYEDKTESFPTWKGQNKENRALPSRKSTTQQKTLPSGITGGISFCPFHCQGLTAFQDRAGPWDYSSHSKRQSHNGVQ